MRGVIAGLAVLVGITAACEAGDREPEPGTDVQAEVRVVGDMLVSGAWLERHLGDPDVLVVHAGGSQEEYDEDHIAGARFLPLSAVSVERDGLMGQLPTVEELEATFAQLGALEAGRVVFYGPPLAAARAFVAMDVLGLGDRAALLDGGLALWREEGRAFHTNGAGPGAGSRTAEGADRPGDPSAGVSGVRGSGARPAPDPDPDRVVDAEWVNDRRDRPDIILLDARPAEQYTGEVAGDDVPRGGHIPGARNIFWEQTLESVGRPVLLDPESLRELFEDAGVQPDHIVVTYCRSGLQSSFLYFVSRYLGYDTRLYDGSFMDWSRRSELPVETGLGPVEPDEDPAQPRAGTR